MNTPHYIVTLLIEHDPDYLDDAIGQGVLFVNIMRDRTK